MNKSPGLNITKMNDGAVMNVINENHTLLYITQLSHVDVVQELQEFRSSDNTSNLCKLTKREFSELSSKLLNS